MVSLYFCLNIYCKSERKARKLSEQIRKQTEIDLENSCSWLRLKTINPIVQPATESDIDEFEKQSILMLVTDFGTKDVERKPPKDEKQYYHLSVYNKPHCIHIAGTFGESAKQTMYDCLRHIAYELHHDIYMAELLLQRVFPHENKKIEYDRWVYVVPQNVKQLRKLYCYFESTLLCNLYEFKMSNVTFAKKMKPINAVVPINHWNELIKSNIGFQAPAIDSNTEVWETKRVLDFEPF